MNYPLISSGKPFVSTNLSTQKSPLPRPYIFSPLRPIRSSHYQNPKNTTINNPSRPKKHIHHHLIRPIRMNPNEALPPIQTKGKGVHCEERGCSSSSLVGIQQMLSLCGFGYWVQGFRGFPWLALNFHMAYNLRLHPSILQLVQNTGNLPMVIKPLHGVLSDALYIGGSHRIPYICIGVLLQILSWGSLALVPFAGEALPTLMACVLLSNLGASIAEVAKDALVAEYGHKHKLSGLQSYAFMALATGGIIGNLLGGFFLLKTHQPKSMFLIFASLLALQLATSLPIGEEILGLPQPSAHSLVKRSISDIIRKQYYDLKMAISEECISRPLTWIVASIAMVPILSGSVFCYQTRYLNLDPSIIGMSRVTGQLMLLSIIVLYDHFWKSIPMRKLIGIVQLFYASSFLLDLALVKQINLKLGISNEVFALCFAGVSEIAAQFKLLPFQVLFAGLAPPGCEGSLTSFMASALCLASIVSGFLGVGLASVLGITMDNYSSLPLGILIQFLAALVPLRLISHVPLSQPLVVEEKKRGMSKRTRRSRRVGRVLSGSVYAYRRERESEAQK